MPRPLDQVCTYRPAPGNLHQFPSDNLLDQARSDGGRQPRIRSPIRSQRDGCTFRSARSRVELVLRLTVGSQHRNHIVDAS